MTKYTPYLWELYDLCPCDSDKQGKNPNKFNTWLSQGQTPLSL
jgi:hypothetical protein